MLGFLYDNAFVKGLTCWSHEGNVECFASS
jgi:hypothetical protein